jgi:hypothetical protein
MLSYNYNNFYRQESDNRFFANKIVYEGVGLYNEDLLYKIYFNEILIASNRFEIGCYVVSGSEVFRLNGIKQINNGITSLSMTYFIDSENTKDFLKVSKNLSASSDIYEYMVVKDNQVISESKLSLVHGEEMYATLENILATEQSTTFKIYASTESTYDIDYAITSPSAALPDEIDTPADETLGSVLEEGTIAISVQANASSFFITSNNFNNTIIINNPNE